MVKGQAKALCDLGLLFMKLGAIVRDRLPCLLRGNLSRGAVFIGGAEE